MPTLVCLSGVAAVCLVAACATADPNGGDGPAADGSGGIDAPAATDAATDAVIVQTVTLAQSTVATIAAMNSAGCVQNNRTRENSYYRVFRLADHGVTRPFVPQRVDVGVETAIGGTGATQSITVRLHTLNGAFQVANLVNVAGQVVSVPNAASGTVLEVPISPQPMVPPTATLVAEVLVPDGVAANNQFFIGSNAAAESQPSYLRGPNCSRPEPVTFASAGFPNTHIVLTVTGTY